LTIVSHRRERKERREKTSFVVKEKDYLTQRERGVEQRAGGIEHREESKGRR